MNGTPPFVSVVLPIYNGERFMEQALQSVIAQDYRPLEIIVVDDGSTDGTARGVRAIAESSDVPLRYVFQENRGPAAARNRGIGMAEGEIIAFQDADDMWTEHKLSRQVELLAHNPTASVVLGYTRVVQSSGNGEWELLSGKAGGPGPVTVLQAALFRRTVFDRVGLLDEKLRRGEDVDWFLRALEEKMQMVVHADVVLLYRRHAASLTHVEGTGSSSLMLALRRSLRRRRDYGGQGGERAPRVDRPMDFSKPD